jgi:hypothetical protein
LIISKEAGDVKDNKSEMSISDSEMDDDDVRI